MKTLYLCMILAACAAVGYCRVRGSTIRAKADRHIGSTKWAKAKWYSWRFRWGTNKCNLFVADVMKEAGGRVPHRNWLYSPIGAWEWANPRSSYLTRDRCWTNVNSPAIGDVAAYGGHVGIVTGSRQTTNAGEYRVNKNGWGFASGTVYWRYGC